MGSSQTGESEWVGGLVQVPAYATGEGAPYRPEALFWLDATGAVCAAQVAKPGELLLLAAEILQQTIAERRSEGGLAPSRVRVASPALAAALCKALPELTIRCEATPEIDALVDVMREQFAEDAVAEQTYLAGEADENSMRALFAAAAALYRAAPWRTRLPEHAHLFVTAPQLELSDAVLAFTGRPDRSPGVVLLSCLEHYNAYRAALPLLARGERPRLPCQLALNFERGAELSPGQRKEIVTHRWEVAGPNAYPWLVVLDQDLIARAPSAHEIVVAEVLARALSELVTQHAPELAAAHSGVAALCRELTLSTRLGQLSVLLTSRVPTCSLSTAAANTGMASPLATHLTDRQ